MARVISIISGKGGVGKTVVAVNIAALLHQNKHENILVETNFTSPTAGLHLGLVAAEHTLDKVVSGKLKIRDVLIEHPSGLTMVSFSMVLKDLKNLKIEDVMKAVRKLKDETGLIIMDGPDGLGDGTRLTIENSDDVIVVTNPELPAVVEALRCSRLAKALGKRVLGIVINRVGEYEYELLPEEIENLTEQRILGIIPEDRILQEAIAHRTPVVLFDSEAPSSVALRELAQDVMGMTLKIPHVKPVLAKKAGEKPDIGAGLLEKIRAAAAKQAATAAKPAAPAMKREEALTAIGGAPAPAAAKPANKGLFGNLLGGIAKKEAKPARDLSKPAGEKKETPAAGPAAIKAAAVVRTGETVKPVPPVIGPKMKKKGLKEKFTNFLHTDYDLSTMKPKGK